MIAGYCRTAMVKHWRLIIVCSMAFGLIVCVVSKLLTPVYQSTALLQIIPHAMGSRMQDNSELAGDQLIQTVAQLAVSAPVVSAVAARYPGLNGQQLAREVSATPRYHTQLLAIVVEDASAVRAADLANALASTLIKWQLQTDQQADSQAQNQLQQDIAVTQQQIDAATAKLDAFREQAGKDAAIAALQTRLAGLQLHYSQLQTALAQLELSQAQNSTFLHIAQPAQPALQPARPDVLLNSGVGLLFGLVLGTLLVLLLERLDTRVRTAEALADLLQWPVLTILWRSYIADRREMVNPGGHDANVESYRLLRTKLGFAGVDDRLHTLAVTSALAGEGKSIVAANLAIFMARAGKNTLLIDADLRQPVQHELFHLAAEKPGLSNAILAMSMLSATGSAAHHQFITPGGPGQPSKIAGAPSFSPAPFMHDVGIPNLRVMPSGSLPPNPAELLNSKAMQRLLMELSDSGADMVICDTPPVCGLPDTGILASKVDGTLVIVDVSHAQRAPLEAMKALLVEAGALVIGCIANKQHNPTYDASHPCQGERWSATIHPTIEDTVPLAGLPTAIEDARNAARLTLPAEVTNELSEAERSDVRVAQ